MNKFIELNYRMSNDNMPQLRHQGKYVYGWSLIKENNTIYFPPDVIKEYSLEEKSDIILFTASKISGGFCISKLETLKSSKLSRIIENNPNLEDEEEIGQIINYKGKVYCHLKMINQYHIELNAELMEHFSLKTGDKLLIIRGSNIAFDCILKGPLIEVANKSKKRINEF